MTRILDLTHSLADRFYQHGIRLEERGEMEPAMRAFERAVRAEGAHVAARLALAFHCRRLGRLDEARTHCEAAIHIQPDPDGYFALGYTLIDQREYDRALEALHTCLLLDPEYHRARYHIAFVYYLRGEYEVAITEFHRAAHAEAEWETFFFLGECYRLTRRPDEATRIFRRALAISRNWGQVELANAQLFACARLAEFEPEQPLGIKDRAYCDCGVAYLGSLLDDGVDVPPYLYYHFRYADLAQTLRRLLALCQAEGWRWTAVVPVDIISLPLALALARWLGVGTEPREAGRTLVVQALGETVDGLQDAAEQLEEATTFCLLVCWPEEWRPDVVGLSPPLGGSVPWYRTDVLDRLLGDELGGAASADVPRMDPRDPDEIARELHDALLVAPPDLNLVGQLDYYRRHPRLRWRT